MQRMRRMLFCRVERVALVLIGALSFSILLWNVNSIHLPPYNVVRREQETIRIPRAANNTTSSPPSWQWPPCERNTSMTENMTESFSSLPAHIQDFLYYRHCRHFPLLLDVPDKCGGAERSGDVFLLLVIKSSPGNYERREVLRKTWAEERLERGKQIRRVFIVGTTGSGFEQERLNQILELEQQEHRDILQWDFNDSLYNLTLKQILLLDWMDRKCLHVHFLFNGDDDIFANTDNMVEYLLGVGNSSQHLFVGNLVLDTGPCRLPENKYFVPIEVQETDVYPPYCGGGGYILSGYTASVIYNMSKIVTLHPIDDAYMGMCLAKAGLKPADHIGIKTVGLYIPSRIIDPFHPCFYREILLAHGFMPPNIYVMWKRVRDPKLKCGLI